MGVKVALLLWTAPFSRNPINISNDQTLILDIIGRRGKKHLKPKLHLVTEKQKPDYF